MCKLPYFIIKISVNTLLFWVGSKERASGEGGEGGEGGGGERKNSFFEKLVCFINNLKANKA